MIIIIFVEETNKYNLLCWLVSVLVARNQCALIGERIRILCVCVCVTYTRWLWLYLYESILFQSGDGVRKLLKKNNSPQEIKSRRWRRGKKKGQQTTRRLLLSECAFNRFYTIVKHIHRHTDNSLLSLYDIASPDCFTSRSRSSFCIPAPTLYAPIFPGWNSLLHFIQIGWNSFCIHYSSFDVIFNG